MLIDPQAITIGTVTTSMPRQLTGTDLGRFVGPMSRLEVQSSASKGRIRSVVRLQQEKVTADPLVSTTNVVVSDTIALTINRPLSGYTDEEILAQVKGFVAWLSASTDKVLKQVIAGEN